MKTVFASFAITLILKQCSPRDSLDTSTSWQNFKSDFSKWYGAPFEEQKREEIFNWNLKTIADHNHEFNRGRMTFRMGINQFADMTFKEYKETFVMNDSLAETYKEITNDTQFYPLVVFNSRKHESGDVPKSFDWRDRGAVTRVRDQHLCGSCYAFAAVAAIEGRWFIKRGELVDLSVQEIVDCSEEKYLAFKCAGGSTLKVFDYVKDHGISSEASYRDEGQAGRCRKKENRIRHLIKGWGLVYTRSEELALEKGLSIIGPLAVAIDINFESFMRYSSGIYYEENCTEITSHSVLLVGYGSEGGQDFWIIKNSFGSKWGERGYLRLARNRGNGCGILTEPIYPVIRKKPQIRPISVSAFFEDFQDFFKNFMKSDTTLYEYDEE